MRSNKRVSNKRNRISNKRNRVSNKRNRISNKRRLNKKRYSSKRGGSWLKSVKNWITGSKPNELTTEPSLGSNNYVMVEPPTPTPTPIARENVTPQRVRNNIAQAQAVFRNDAMKTHQNGKQKALKILNKTQKLKKNSFNFKRRQKPQPPIRRTSSTNSARFQNAEGNEYYGAYNNNDQGVLNYA